MAKSISHTGSAAQHRQVIAFFVVIVSIGITHSQSWSEGQRRLPERPDDSIKFDLNSRLSVYNPNSPPETKVQIQPAVVYKVPGGNYSPAQGTQYVANENTGHIEYPSNGEYQASVSENTGHTYPSNGGFQATVSKNTGHREYPSSGGYQPTESENTGNIKYPSNEGYQATAPPPSENSDTDFSLEMMKILVKQDSGNIVVSPLSLATLLALLAQGAEGNTLLQLEKALSMKKNKAKRYYGNVVENLQKRDRGNDIIFQNAIFVKNGNLNAGFKNKAIVDFKANVEITEFRNPSLAASQINQWVSKNTKGKIPNIISAENLGQQTDCVLVNAVHFKSVWKTKFDPQRTVKLPFHPHPGQEVDASFMHMSSRFPAGEDKAMGAKWVELPFDGSDFSLILVLPSEQHGLDRLIDRLTKDDLNTIMNTKKTENAILSIPKFNLDYSKSLVDVLLRMGVTDMFNDQSQLRNILNGQNVRVGQAIQKAVISIDENGVTAAAATVLTVNTLSLASYYDDFRFNANQPFLAIIVKKLATPVPIFMAKVIDPSRSH